MSDEERYESLKSQLQEMQKQSEEDEQDEPDAEEVGKLADEFNQLAQQLGKPGLQVSQEE